MPRKGMAPLLLILISALLAACAGSAPQKGLPYVIVTLAQDTPVLIRALTRTPPPKATRLLSQTATRSSSLTPTPLVGCVTQNSIFVRSGPGPTFPATSGLVVGDCVTVLAYSPDQQWAQFSDGWVFAAYLNFTHLTIDEELTMAAGATITPTPTLIPTLKKG